MEISPDLPENPVRDLAMASLSAREWKVLLLLSEGKSNAEIAEEMFVTVKSVHNNKNRISRKLSLSGYQTLNNFAKENREKLIHWYKILGNKSSSEKFQEVFLYLTKPIA